jgi:NMD protein affecting ribosome stability and mRNA decay
MKSERGGFRMLRHEQLLQELEHDPLKPARKLPEPTRCPECAAVFRRGRWTWAAAPEEANAALCPACRRVREELPSGFVTLKGAFFSEHRDEILQQVHRCEAAQKRNHPLQRIMALKPKGRGMVVTTTDPHLARRIGDALHHAYKGELEYRYNKQDKLLRVSWSR